MKAYGIEVKYLVYRYVNSDGTPDWGSQYAHSYFANSYTDLDEAKRLADEVVLSEWKHAKYLESVSYGCKPVYN